MKIYKFIACAMLVAPLCMAGVTGNASAVTKNTEADSTSMPINPDERNAGTSSRYYKPWYPPVDRSVYRGIPIGTIIPLSYKMDKTLAAKQGYLLCDGSYFKPSDYPELARKLVVCPTCGKSLSNQAEAKGTISKYSMPTCPDCHTKGVFAYNERNLATGATTTDKSDETWDEDEYGDKNNKHLEKAGYIRLPNLQGNFMRGYNDGKGYNISSNTASGYYGGAAKDSKYASARVGRMQKGASNGENSSKGDDNLSVIAMLPVKEDGQALKFEDEETVVKTGAGNVTVDIIGTEDVTSKYLSKTGKILKGITTLGLGFIPGLFDKSKTYTIGTPTTYSINADIGDTEKDKTGDIARPQNQAVYYYVKAK